MTAGRLRNLPPQPDVDIRQIIQEAQNRWLRPIEVCEILRNYRQHNFKLNPVPPVQPQSGSLFLFDRKTLRYFRKDGHNWRKKKDGKTVREAHERLKAGSIDVLHCYYAHGEENPNFQRRAYWMLDTAYEHIVLVHYREVTENNRSCILRSMHDYSATERSTNSASSVALQPQSSQFSVSSMNISSSMASPDTVEMPGTSHSPELEDVDSADPDESEEVVPEIAGDQQGLQPSLLEQLTDRHQVPGIHSQLGSEPWQSGLRNTNGLGAVDGQVNPGLFPPQEDFKPSFPKLQHVSRRSPPASNFTRTGDANSISRQFADILDSPGTAYNFPHQNNSAASAVDLTAWNNFMVHGRGNGNGVVNYVKPELNSSPWAQMLEEVTTPFTRNRLLEGAGLTQPGLGLSPLGKDSSHASGAQVSPKGKGIADALSPRNLGREPQTALEADLRNVTEQKVLKEAEERVRNRWQTSHSESPFIDIANERIHAQSGAQQMNVMGFGEPDTLGALVRSGQSPPPQDSGVSYSKQSSWSQQAQVTNGQIHNQFESQSQQGNSRFHQDESMHLSPPPPQQNIFESSGLLLLSPTVDLYLKDVRSDEVNNNLDIMESYRKLGSFGKLDSFGRWMNSTDDISDIPVGGTSTSLWGYQEDAMSGVTHQMEEGDGIEPSVSSEQLFNILDFSPEWGSSTEDTKVIICGSFLKNSNFADHKWCCMFGAVEVPAESVGDGTFRCIAPPQEPGPVYFYITCNDRQARSQVRKFHYRSLVSPANESMSSAESHVGDETSEDLLLKIRLSRMLFGHATAPNNGRIGSRMQTFEERDNDEWTSLEDMVNTQEKPLLEVKEQLLQVVLKHRLEEWLQVKARMEDGWGPSVLDDRGQGVPHFMAALGYVWSIGPLCTSDIPVNFRDAAGWTALHWAAKQGREKMVVALLDSGAAPVLSSDPSHRCPRGETAADLASAGGHGGIAAYLAEKSLTERLSGLTIKDGVLNEIDKMTANLEGEKAVALLARRTSITRSVRAAEDEARLRTSLEAVRVSAHAAALIQSAFRQHSFRRRAQVEQYKLDEYGLSPAEMHNFVAARKIQLAFRGHQKNKIKNLAATRIQQKFRGWKGRKEFQTIRQRIIKLQAHVRGRLVRNHFRKIIWSVSIVEKVVLRWLRKRKGLRGFVQPKKLEATEGNEDLIKDGRDKQKEFVEEEVEKVRLMARQKLDREQYTRMREEERRTSASKGEMNDYVTSPRDYME